MKTLRVAICVMLIVGVLAMSLSVFALEPSPTPDPNDYEYPDVIIQEINEELMSRYIWLTLNSWGIRIAYDDMDSFYNEIESQIITWVIEYLASLPSVYSINEWIAPWQAGYDYWGNLALNNSALEDIQDFASWLIGEYNLTDNSTEVVNPSYSVQGVALFEPGVYYRTNNDTWVSVSAYTADDSPNTFFGYYVWRRTDKIGTNDEWYIVRLANQGGQTYYRGTAISVSGETQNVYSGSGYPTQGGHYWYSETSVHYNFANGFIYPVGDYYEGTYQEFQSFNNTAQVIQEGDTKIVTTLILLPSDSPTYTQGDGITIIDGSPNYGEITFPDSISVDNLPAIITQRKIPDVGNDEENPGFSVPWQAINGLIQYVAAPAGAIMALVNEAPVEGVIMLYALIGGMIIFGMIRIMREH